MKWLGTMITRKWLGCLSVVLMVAAVWTVTPQTAAQPSPVAAAAKSNDIKTVRALILKKTDVNAPESDGSTALLWAAYNDNLEMTKALLAAGAKVNATNRYGLTALLQAAGTGDTPIVDVLLKAGANANQAHPEGETPLMAAARAGHEDTVRLLVANGANTNSADKFQEQTPLMWAAAEGHLKVVETLLEVGANPNLRAHVSTITERKSADHPSGGFTALMFAARNGHEDVVKALIKGGANVKQTNGDDANGLNGATALVIAIVNDRFDLAAKMVEWGADPNDGALYHAVDMHDATTDMRARDGSKLRPNNPNKMTSIDLIKFLLDKGADPNKPYIGQLHSISMCCGDFHSASPFYKAAMQSDVEVLKMMLARGANAEWVPGQVNAPGAGRGANANYGRPALFAAMSGGRGAAFGGGPGFSREGPPPFREAGIRKPAEAVKVLLAAGADPNVWSWPDNSPPIHKAVSNGDIELIRALVTAGAKLDSYDNNGDTPLTVAEKANTPEAIKKVDDAIIAAIANGTPPPAKGAPPAEVVALIKELMQQGGVK